MIPAASTLRKGGDWVPSDGLDAKHAGQLERPTHKTSFRAATPSPAGDRLLLRLCCPAHPREGVRGVGRRGKAPGGPGSAGAASSDLRADLFVPATLPAPLRPPVIPWSSCLLHLSALGPFTRGAAPAPVPPPETDADAGASPRALPECGAARNKRIVGVLHRFIERQTASAYVSTLGGGYFLCDYLGHAQRAALVQLRIAATSGDEKAVGRCLVHLAYSQIKLQRYQRAERALRVASALAVRHQDRTLGTMVTAARCTIRDLRAYGALPDAGPTHDDFVRLRAHAPPREAPR